MRGVFFSYLICWLTLTFSCNVLFAQKIVKTIPKPPDEDTAIPKLPKPGMVYVHGHWFYDDKKEEYVWAHGHYTRSKKGCKWVPGRWKKVKKGYKYIPGNWKKTDKKPRPAFMN